VNAVAAELNGHFDLSAAASAAIAEALAHPFRFAYKGELYELPNQKTWPLSAMAGIGETGDIEAFMAAIGAKDGVYQQLVGAGLCIGELNVLIEQASADAGVGSLKNSPPPARRGSTRR
jgi:hypothetical protein